MGFKTSKLFKVLFTLAAVAAVSFSTAATAAAATSYSTDVTYASNSYFTINGLSIANSVGYELNDYEFDSSSNRSYATVHLSFPLTVTYNGSDDYGSFYFRLPLTFTRSFTSTTTVIDKTLSVVSPYESISAVILPSTGGSTYYLSMYGDDVEFLYSKAYRFNINIDYYVSWTGTSTPNNLGSVTVSSSGFAASTAVTSDFSSLTMQIVDGIDGSASMENMLSALTAISSNTALLSSVLSQLQSINSTFSDFYALLGSYVTTGSQNPNYQNYFAAMRLYMQRLQAMISGWSQNNPTTPLDLASLTFDRWVSIISTALNNQAPDVTQAEADRTNVQSLSDTQHQQEAVYFTQAAQDIGNVDFNVTFPSGVINAAVTLMSLTGMIWERLGDFQYIAIATLVSGLIVVILGVINKFNRSSSRSSRPNRKAGE